MRILLFNWRDIRHPKAGGAEIVTLEHAKGWVRAGHEVTWLTSSFAGAKKNEVIDGVTIVRVGGSISVYIFAPLHYILHKKYFDVIVDEIHGLPFFTPLYVGQPKVAFIHEIAGDIWDFMYRFPFNRIGKLVEKLYFCFYRRVLFWTDAPSTINDLSAFGIPKSHCQAIPCPITNAPRSSPHAKEPVPTYIFVSRVVKMKGIEEVIKAFSFIVTQSPASKLWIVGGGDKEYIHSLREMLAEYNIAQNVEFVGQVSEKEKLDRLARAHLLLHASVKEGWGLVVLEAASQWTPSIVYNVSGLIDVVKNGKTGIVLRQNSPREMAQEAVKLLVDHKRYKGFQKNGIAWVRSLTWSAAIRQSLSLLESANRL